MILAERERETLIYNKVSSYILCVEALLGAFSAHCISRNFVDIFPLDHAGGGGGAAAGCG